MAQDYAKAFYHSKEWRDCQAAFMKSKYYICEQCGGAAKICHHKIYLTPANINDPNITLNWDNLEALCQDCHTRQHLAGGVCAEDLYFDDEGNLVQSPRLLNHNSS
jgi:5-methylcytosine-specific restriction endonuclease McrA